MLRQAVFLVGGRGAPLGAGTEATPKPCLPVAGRPFISYLVDNAARHGFTAIILLAGHGADIVERDWGRGSPPAQRLAGKGVSLSVVVEPEPAGSAGALAFIRDRLDDTFLVAHGDSFFDFNWLDLLTVPSADDWQGRIALTQARGAGRHDRVELAQLKVTAFGGSAQPGPGLVNVGVYLLRRPVVERIVAMPMSLEHDVLPMLATEGRLYGRVYDRPLVDIGSPMGLARADAVMNDVWRRPAVFLDRDGVLNVDHDFVCRPDQIDWIAGAMEAIKRFNDAGYLVFVVSNQSGVARGYFSEEDVVALHRWMAGELQTVGAHVDGFEYCPYHPEGVVARYRRVSERRKPAPGMLLDCFAQWPVDKSASFLIGDKQSDLEAAKAAGIAGHLFAGGNLIHFIDSLPPRPRARAESPSAPVA